METDNCIYRSKKNRAMCSYITFP